MNGANGLLRGIVYELNENENETRSVVLFIEFDNYNGPRFFDNSSLKRNLVPINPISIYIKSLNASRTQFPIRLAYTLTIRKSDQKWSK